MIKAENLVVGKRYWLDGGKDISGIYQGRFNPEPGLDYITFNDIIKTEGYVKEYHIRKNGDIEFAYMEHLTFPECKVTSKQLELTF